MLDSADARATDHSRQRAIALLGAGVLAGAAFALVARASARRQTVEPDHRIQERVVDGMDDEVREAAENVAPAADQMGKWWVYAPAALTAATAVAMSPANGQRDRRARAAGAVAIALVPALATLLSPAFDHWLPQPPVGRRRRPLDHPVFPSGHAFRTTAVALTTGYVVVREGIAGAGSAWSLALFASTAIGFSRLVREKHLASDVVGGWLAGTMLATMAAGGYELARATR